MPTGLDPSATEGITRHFVTVGERQVHYLRAGSGPCVVLCHGSPESGLAFTNFIHLLKDRFTVIAPDTPGNGNSDPLLHDDPEISDYAEALGETMDALGIEKSVFYGFHTGADISMCLATQRPELVSLVVANGYPIFSDEETALILENYLPAWEPSWDGSHLCWVWARFHEQFMFFPWHERDAAHRMARTMVPLEFLQFKILEVLRCGDEYRKPYRAAFRQKSEDLLPLLKVPAIISALTPDPLFQHLDRIEDLPDPLPDCARIERLGDDYGDAFAKFKTWFEEQPAPPPPPAPAATPYSGPRPHQSFVTVADGQVYFQKREGAGRPIVLLHDPASSSRMYDAMLMSSDTSRPYYAIDFPGSGESDNTLADGVPTIDGYAERLGQTLDALGESEVDIVGYYSGACAGIELAIARPKLVKTLALIGMAQYSDEEQADLITNYTPDMSARWDGTHLISAWRMMRQQGLFWPWYNQTAEGTIEGEPHLDNKMLQRRVVDLMKIGNNYQHAYRGLWTYKPLERLPLVKSGKWFADLAWDPTRDRGRKIALATDTGITALPPAIADWAPHFEKLLTD